MFKLMGGNQVLKAAHYLRLHLKVTTTNHKSHCQNSDAMLQACTTVNNAILHKYRTITAAFIAGNATAKQDTSSCVCKTSSTLTSLPSLPSAQTLKPVSLHTDAKDKNIYKEQPVPNS
jgi:hypothetical protein